LKRERRESRGEIDMKGEGSRERVREMREREREVGR
jgi:hypothetical protein